MKTRTKSLRTHSGTAIVLGVLAALVIGGCGRGDRSSPEEGRDRVKANANADAEWTPHPALNEHQREHEWNRQQMETHFKRVMLADLPDYVEDLRGVGGEGDESYSEGTYAYWGGVVPQDRIGDFRDFIRGLGVPEEWMDKSSGWLGGRTDSDEWVAPDPPATRLVLRRTAVIPGSGNTLGLAFTKGEATTYWFDNPNLPNSSVSFCFSAKTGRFRITETILKI